MKKPNFVPSYILAPAAPLTGAELEKLGPFNVSSETLEALGVSSETPQHFGQACPCCLFSFEETGHWTCSVCEYYT